MQKYMARSQVGQEKRRRHGGFFGQVLKMTGEIEIFGVCLCSWKMYQRGQQIDWEVRDPRARMTPFCSALTVRLLPGKSFLP